MRGTCDVRRDSLELPNGERIRDQVVVDCEAGFAAHEKYEGWKRGPEEQAPAYGQRENGGSEVTRYGFRVYRVQLHHDTGRIHQPWNVPGWAYAKQAQADAQVLTDGTPLLSGSIGVGEIQRLGAALPVQPITLPRQTYVKWLSVQGTGRRISVRLQFGRGADFDEALKPGPNISLTDTAPSRTYRMELLAPSDDHGTGLLAVETIQRTAPVSAFVDWVNASMWLDRGEAPWKRMTFEQVTAPISSCSHTQDAASL